MFSYKLIFISIYTSFLYPKLKRNLTTSSISGRIKIEKDTTDKRLVRRYMYTF